jgi:hypothetical protein
MATMLARAFDFTKDDLAENQQGRLSDKQKTSLRERMIVWSIFGSLAFIWCSVIVIGMMRNVVDLFGFILTCFVALFVFGIGYGLFTLIRDSRSDLRDGVVASVTGLAEPYTRRGYRGSTVNYLKIGTLDFMISPRYPAFRAETRYQIFYAPATKVILSAVRLDD